MTDEVSAARAAGGSDPIRRGVVAHDMPFGAQLVSGGVRFRLWAPGAEGVTLLLGAEEREAALTAAGEGWYEAVVADAAAGTRYRYQLGDGTRLPDPASRAQDGGPFGPSIVCDPGAYRWRETGWRGRPWEETVLYELHLGSFTAGGTFTAAIERLDALAALGITAIELMPVSDFPGRRGWGYDGVLPFAPASIYGRPDELKALIDAAHGRGLAVFLDVVYNHFGPAGNFLPRIAPQMFDASRRTPWGPAIDFTRPEVRAFFRHNALYWLSEYRFDGLRFDAVHAIDDPSQPDILTEIADAVRRALPDRHVHLVLENDENEAFRLAGAPGGAARYDAQWNDDLHHAAHVVLTGETDGYYEDFAEGPAARLARGLAEGFVYQGEHAPHRGRARGEPSRHLPPIRFVNFLQNHDQIGNRAFGDRIEAPAAALDVAYALLMLSPSIPMLFMGEEWATRRPFPFFCDFEGELADAVRNGRREEFGKFAAFRDPAILERLPDPLAAETFAAAVLDAPDDAEAAAERQATLAALIALRRLHIVPGLAGIPGGAGSWSAEGDLIEIGWTLGDGRRLAIAAHLGPGAAAPRQVPPGEIIHETPRGFAASLPGGAAGWGFAAAIRRGDAETAS